MKTYRVKMSLAAAIRFGIENGQIAVFILSEGREVRLK